MEYGVEVADRQKTRKWYKKTGHWYRGNMCAENKIRNREKFGSLTKQEQSIFHHESVEERLEGGDSGKRWSLAEPL
jgi:hypothetical protein